MWTRGDTVKTVLLIDDDPVFRGGITTALRKGYTFLEAEDPSEGIRILETNPEIRVILLDLSFPSEGVPATAVLDFVHQRPNQYRVIVLTAREDLLAPDEALAHSVFHYLPKSHRSAAIRFSLDQAFKDLERAALVHKIEFLQEVQRRINENRDTNKTLELICKSVREIVGAYTCHIRVYDFARGDFHLAGFAPNGTLRQAFETPREKGEFFSGKVVEKGKPEHCEDLRNDARFLELKRKALEDRILSPEEAEYWDSARSAYVVPISTGFFGKAVDAVLNVSSRSVGFFDDEKRGLVDEFVHQASLAITKDWLQRKRAELHEDYSSISKMLSDMRDRLAGPDVLHGLYRTVTQKLSELVNAEVVSIFLYNDRTERIEKVAEYRGAAHVEALDEEYEKGQSFVGKVFETQQTEQLQTWQLGMKPEDDPRFDHTNTEQYASIIPSGTLEHYLGVPIKAGGEIQGVLRAMNKKSKYYDERLHNGGTDDDGTTAHPSRFCLLERGFSPDCRNVVEITASHLAIAIQNARLLKERDRQVRQLRTLGEVGRILSSELDSQSVLEQTIKAMAKVMQAEICMLFLKDDGADRVVLRECYGIPEKEIRGAWYAIGKGVTGVVAATGKARLIEHAATHAGKYDRQIRRYLTERDGRPREIESFIAVPIVAKSKVLGVMKVINKLGEDPHYFLADLRVFRTFGQYVGIAIENAQFYELTSQRLALAERDAAMSELVRAVAHEINNTSGLIPVNIALIREEVGEVSAHVDEMLSRIDDVAKQATEFANEITGFSATRRGERRMMDLNDVIRSALGELERDPYTAQLTTSLAERPLVCHVFENPLKQIIRNIVLNALQALEKTEHGTVTVSTAEGEGPLAGWAVVEFKDNGPGIPPQHLERIFAADFTTKPAGNGIGLWLVRKQLDLIEGTIEVASEVGSGAQFTVKIPLAPPGEEPADE
jgi:signal transduction histidine kinase/CheY-like chemotaxis protein